MKINIKKGKYKIYHIPGKKIGCTTNVIKRVEQEQGYKLGEYEILYETDDISEASKAEKALQKDLGYKEDIKLYKDLFKKTMNKHSSSEATTTYKVPIDKINAKFLADMKIETLYGTFVLDSQDKIEWVLSNVNQSQYGPDTCYTYNKAMSEAGAFQKQESDIYFDEIRSWADIRGIVKEGNDIGDMVVVLTNLASLRGFKIEDCINHAYKEIANRTGKMVNGTFVKDK